MPNSLFPDLPSAQDTQPASSQTHNSLFPELPQSQTSSQPASQTGNSLFPGLQSSQDPTPQDVTNAEQNLGNQDYDGWCETFQEQMTGSPKMGDTAADAWNNYVQEGKVVGGLQDAQPGDLVYFDGDNGLGHTGIISGKDKSGNTTFVSATDNGVENLPINQWLQTTGQQVLGIVPK